MSVLLNKRYLKYYLAASVSVVTLAVYLRTLRNGFINLDDDVCVYNNPHIRNFNGDFLRWAFTDAYYFDYWRPIVWISHALDYYLWGLNPAGHHFTGVVLHAVNTFIVVILVSALFEASARIGRGGAEVPLQDARMAMITAVVTGTLFGLHPLRVESVAWIAVRVDLVYGMFFLLGLLAYTKYAVAAHQAEGPAEGLGRHETFPGKGWYALSFALFVLSCASKPMAVTFPFVLLILDRHPLQRFRSGKEAVRAVAEKVPFILVSVAISISAYSVQAARGAVKSLDAMPVSARPLLAAKALVVYLWKTIMPVELITFAHPYPRDLSYLSPDNLFAVAVAAGITALCIFFGRRQKTLPAVWGYYVISLSPVIGIVSIREVYIADRYTYLPGLGPLLLIGMASALVWKNISAADYRRGLFRLLASVAAVAIVASLGYLTLKQTAVWKNSITVWSRAIEMEPDRVPFYYANRGLEFRKNGLFARAMDDYNRAISLDPDFVRAYIGRGDVFKEMGRTGQALEDYGAAIALAPSAVAYTNRGIVFGETGQSDKALADFNAAIAIDGSYADAYVGRGLLFVEKGRPDLAVADLTRAVALNPSSGEAYLDRGVAFERMNDLLRAKEDYSMALELNPSDAQAYENRAVVFGKMGMPERAIDDYSRVVALRPDNSGAYAALGDLYSSAGNKARAAENYSRACDLGNEAGCRALRAQGSR